MVTEEAVQEAEPCLTRMWIDELEYISSTGYNFGIRNLLIWESSARAVQWIPTWQGLDFANRKLCK